MQGTELRNTQNRCKECTHCLRDPEIDPQLRSLPFFLPLPSNVEEPPYTYLFVAMEPSGNWLRAEDEGRKKLGKSHVESLSRQKTPRLMMPGR